jgi:multidrug resistance protein, MATE family
VRVGNELGAGNPRAAAFSVVVVTSLSLAVSVVCAAVVLCLRDQLSYFFTGGEAVAHAVSDLCPLLAVTIVLNGVQPVLSGESAAAIAHVHPRSTTAPFFSARTW